MPENEKPPISHEAGSWHREKPELEVMGYHGEGTKGGLTCGCEPHHYVLKGSFDEIWTRDEGPLHSRGHGEFQIPIQFNDDGSLSGGTRFDVAETNSYTASVMSCSEDISYPGVAWKVIGSVDGLERLRIGLVSNFRRRRSNLLCTEVASPLPTHSRTSVPNRKWISAIMFRLAIRLMLRTHIHSRAALSKFNLQLSKKTSEHSSKQRMFCLFVISCHCDQFFDLREGRRGRWAWANS